MMPPPGELGRELSSAEASAALSAELKTLTILPLTGGAVIQAGSVVKDGASVVVCLTVSHARVKRIRMSLSREAASLLFMQLGKALE